MGGADKRKLASGCPAGGKLILANLTSKVKTLPFDTIDALL
jgi:hypothetical protein